MDYQRRSVFERPDEARSPSQAGKCYRLRMHNTSDDIHPSHLHRHSFEPTKFAKFAGIPTADPVKFLKLRYKISNGDTTRYHFCLALVSHTIFRICEQCPVAG
jgi:FtsP/CotA-like multicopper oxidase with cupredoxin domain